MVTIRTTSYYITKPFPLPTLRGFHDSHNNRRLFSYTASNTAFLMDMDFVPSEMKTCFFVALFTRISVFRTLTFLETLHLTKI
jgi:hypothetical protein